MRYEYDDRCFLADPNVFWWLALQVVSSLSFWPPGFVITTGKTRLVIPIITVLILQLSQWPHTPASSRLSFGAWLLWASQEACGSGNGEVRASLSESLIKLMNLLSLTKLAQNLLANGPHKLERTGRRVRALYDNLYIFDTTEYVSFRFPLLDHMFTILRCRNSGPDMSGSIRIIHNFTSQIRRSRAACWRSMMPLTMTSLHTSQLWRLAVDQQTAYLSSRKAH